MKGVVLLFIVLVLSAGLSAQVLTCRQIQETTNVSGNSTYMDQAVQVRGIVTAIKRGSFFYIGDPLSATDDGKWSGLYVSDATLSNTVQLGDMFRLNGTVKEINNRTQLMQLTGNQMESSGNAIPISKLTSTALLPYGNSISEPWEGVLVRFNDVEIKTAPSLTGLFQIADAGVAGVAETRVGGFLYTHPSSEIVPGQVWYQIQGVVDYSLTDGYRVLPRSYSDMIKVDDILATVISVKSTKADLDQTIAMEVKTTKLLAAWNVTKYSMTLRINPTLVRFNGVDYSGTLTASNPTVTVAGDLVTITYDPTPAAAMLTAGEATLIKLLLEPRSYDVVPIDIISFSYNDTPINNFQNGSLSVIIDEFKAYMNISRIDQYNKVFEQNIFNPSIGQKINIEYGTTGGFLARTIIRIYDAQGRLVATPLNENFDGIGAIQLKKDIDWNGRDRSMNLVPPGLYYCHMEVSNRATGAIARTVQPLVIKSQLK
jgi:hypothetical protein